MSSRRIAVWCGPEQAQMVRETVDAAGLELKAIGSSRPTDAAAMSAALNATRIDDPRSLFHLESIDAIWLASPDILDEELRRLARADRTPLFTTEPPMAALTEAVVETGLGNDCLEFVPLLRKSPGFRAAGEVLPQFGPVSCVNVFFRSGPGQGSLLARLFDAMDLVHTICGSPLAINAALAGPLADVPERLAALRGHMTINLRFKSNRCGCIALSDHAGSWFRGVTVLGEHGHLRISDSGFEWVGVDGRLVDRHADPQLPKLPELIGSQISRRLAGSGDGEAPLNHILLMSLCEAARLSCLTGQDEAPAKLAHMMSRP